MDNLGLIDLREADPKGSRPSVRRVRWTSVQRWARKAVVGGTGAANKGG